MPNAHRIAAIPGLAIAGLLLALTGCFGGPAYMPPEEALKRASASIDRTLQHAREDATAPVAHDPSQTPPDPSELLLWYPEHPILGPALASEGPALASFAKDNPNVRLRPQHIGPWHYAVQKLTVSLASGDMPDIAVVKRDLLPHLAEAGRIARLDTLLPQTFLDDLRPEVLRDHRIGEALYALPADGFCTVLFYTSSEVLAPPETWTALLDFAKSFDPSPRQGTDRRFPLGDLPFLESLWSAGGDVYRDGHSALNEPVATETMNFLWSLRNGGVALPGTFGRGDAAMSSFDAGRIAMTVASSAWLAQPRTDLEIGIAPVPGKNGPISLRSSDVIVVFQRYAGAKRDAIAAALDLLTGPLVLGQHAANQGSVPIRKSTAASVTLPQGLDRAFTLSRSTPLDPAWPEIQATLKTNIFLGLWWKQKP